MSAMSIDPSEASDWSGLLADAALRRGLTRFVRRRVPALEVEDIVQATLTEALASRHQPDEAKQLQRWVYGIARHKCVDFYRRHGREAPAPEPVDGEVPAEDEPLSAGDLLRWAEKELPEGEQAHRTLEWMLREAGGDKLEAIADEERIPAPRVRQRVARMRKHYRTRWAAQIAAIVAAVLLVVAGALVWRSVESGHPVADDVSLKPERLHPLERAAELRRQAFRACDDSDWERCLERLDEAASLDPAGDRQPRVVTARQVAGEALEPKEQNSAPPAPAPQDEDEDTETTNGKTEPPPKAPPQLLEKKGFNDSLEQKQKMQKYDLQQKMQKKASPEVTGEKSEPTEIEPNPTGPEQQVQQQPTSNVVRKGPPPARQQAMPPPPEGKSAAPSGSPNDDPKKDSDVRDSPSDVEFWDFEK